MRGRMSITEERDLDIARVYQSELRRPGYVLGLSPSPAPSRTQVTTVSLRDYLNHKEFHVLDGKK